MKIASDEAAGFGPPFSLDVAPVGLWHGKRDGSNCKHSCNPLFLKIKFPVGIVAGTKPIHGSFIGHLRSSSNIVLLGAARS